MHALMSTQGAFGHQLWERRYSVLARPRLALYAAPVHCLLMQAAVASPPVHYHQRKRTNYEDAVARSLAEAAGYACLACVTRLLQAILSGQRVLQPADRSARFR